jgi:hypothetical protein
VLNLRKRLIFARAAVPGLRNQLFRSVWVESLDYIKKHINQLELIFSKSQKEETFEALMSHKRFNPTITAQNGLNFISKDDEVQICLQEQPLEINNIFKIIYILINYDYEKLGECNLINQLLKIIFPLLKVNSLSKCVFYYSLFRTTIFKRNM